MTGTVALIKPDKRLCRTRIFTVAYAFMGNNADFNIDMSIMYFYCGFYVMFLLENTISVQIMILVSCVLAMILVVLLAVNDILVVKGASRYIDEEILTLAR